MGFDVLGWKLQAFCNTADGCKLASLCAQITTIFKAQR